MSKSTHQIAIKAKDQTAGAFASIQARAGAAGAKLRSMLGGALAAAGAYMGVRAIAGTINELGKLSDIAQKTSTSVDDLTKTTTALNILGIQNMGVEQMAKAFQMMEKNTGRTGMEGFYQTINELGKIPDIAERGEAAMAIFGRSGMEFMPLINAADTSVNALKDVVDVMPGIPQSAANAGDDAADAMNIMSQNVKSIWMQGIAAIVGWFGKNYEGGIRSAALNASNSMILYAKIAVQTALGYYRKFTGFLRRSAAGSARSSAQRWPAVPGVMRSRPQMRIGAKTAKAQDIVEENRRAEEAKDRERWGKDFEDRRVKIAKFRRQYQGAVRSTKDRTLAGVDDALAKSAAVKRIQNELIMGGSAKANQLAVIGPQMQSEGKKQTAILERIAKNTQKTEENTRETSEGERFKVVNG